MVERPPRVKICGLTHPEDARMADRLGAEYLGVVLSAGFSRSVDLRRAPTVVEGTRARRVAVLVDEDVRSAETRARAIAASVVQLHGDEGPEAARALREAGPWEVWKAVRAREADDVRRAADRFAGALDGLLVEGWRPGAVGGSGLRLDLDARALRDALPEGVAFVLAGGLTPDGVAEAVARFRPDVVDVSSGVERTLARKDEELVAAFLRAARGATVSAPDAP